MSGPLAHTREPGWISEGSFDFWLTYHFLSHEKRCVCVCGGGLSVAGANRTPPSDGIPVTQSPHLPGEGVPLYVETSIQI